MNSRSEHSIDDYVRIIVDLIRRGEAAGEWPPDLNPYETATILNGSVNQVIITWLLYRKPRNLMKAVGSIVDRTMTFSTLVEWQVHLGLRKAAQKRKLCAFRGPR